jgi:hypothetical protein
LAFAGFPWLFRPETLAFGLAFLGFLPRATLAFIGFPWLSASPVVEAHGGEKRL